MNVQTGHKLAIVTRADENIRAITDVSFPLIKRFAKEWDADFIVLDGESPCNVGNGKYHYRIMEMANLLKKYERVAHIDADVIMAPTCPNLFEWVQFENVGTVFEDKGTRQADRRARLAAVQSAWRDVGWREGYINTGVFVTSFIHNLLFRPFIDEQGQEHYWTESGFDDVHLGWMLNYECFGITELPYKCNHMSMFSEPWNGSKDRLKSHIIHYAGGARFPGSGWEGKDSQEHIVALMKQDKKVLWGSE
jgi:hypothetical protein